MANPNVYVALHIFRVRTHALDVAAAVQATPHGPERSVLRLQGCLACLFIRHHGDVAPEEKDLWFYWLLAYALTYTRIPEFANSICTSSCMNKHYWIGFQPCSSAFLMSLFLCRVQILLLPLIYTSKRDAYMMYRKQNRDTDLRAYSPTKWKKIYCYKLRSRYRRVER